MPQVWVIGGTFDSVTNAVAATFSAREHGPASAVARLGELGFDFGPAHTLTRTLLDTFDGRLHRAGLQLELREGEDIELVLTGDRTAPAHLVVDSVPRFAADLAPGPLRARLLAIVEVRALLPVVRIAALCTSAAWHDRAGKTEVMATLHDDVYVYSHDDIDLAPWMIEIHELTGYEKAAGRVRDIFDDLGLQHFGASVLDVAAAAAGVNLGGYSSSPTVPLHPEMPAIEGFRAVLANLAETIMANWQGTEDQIDAEFLHDLRIAVRRTRCVVAQGKNVLPPSVVVQSRERFSWLGTLTSPARDLDVYLIEWDGYTGPLGADVIAALDPVRELLEQRHQAAYTALVGALRSPEAREWMPAWYAWLSDPVTEELQGIHAQRPLGPVVARRITRAQVNLVERGRLIRPDTPAEQVHNLRKDAKKLRYLLECFASLLPDAARKAFVQRLKAFQDNLGEHQDAEVHVAELRAISLELHQSGASAETMLAIGQLTERLDQRRVAARTEFAERFAAYDTAATQRTLRDALAGVST